MKDPYLETAAEVLAQPESITQLADWFDSDQPRSAYQFGSALGRNPDGGKIADTIRTWIEKGRCTTLVAGYLNGTLAATTTLAPVWGDLLERVSESHPEYAAQLTLQSDYGDRGVRRLLRLMTDQKIPPQYLRGLSVPPWLTVLGESAKANILHAVLYFIDVDPSGMINTGLALIAGWTEYGEIPLSDALIPPSLRLQTQSLQARIDPSNWGVLLRLNARTSPAEAADAAIRAITSMTPSRTFLEDTALEVLIDLSARDPKLVMDVVGHRMKDKEASPFFSICRLPGLFEAIGVNVVRQWLAENGSSYAKYIARHVASPFVEDGRPMIPPLTEWLLKEYEASDAVFREFCMGRHAGIVRSGHAKDQRTALEASLQPFAGHPVRRIRDWVKFELDNNMQDAKLDDYLDDMQERM